MQATKLPLKVRLKRMTPGQMVLFGLLACVFIWFIMACMVLPIMLPPTSSSELWSTIWMAGSLGSAS